MKYTTTLLFLFLSFSGYSQKEHSCAAYKSGISQAKSATLNTSQIARTEKYDVKHYLLDLEMTHLSKTLSGTVTMTAKTRTALDTALFELHPNLAIIQVRLDGQVVPFVRRQTAVLVAVNKGAGQSFQISTTYAGTPPDAGSNPFGDAGLSNAFSGLWGNQITWSLSQPFSAYEWWPCKQSLKDKIDSVEVKITIPDSTKAGSNGLLQGVVNLGGGKVRFEWKHKHSIDYYLVSVAVGEYVDYSIYAHPPGSSDSILVQNYIYENPGTLIEFKEEIDKTTSFINVFSELFGPYPFKNEKYGHCMAPFSGGMEHQTMTTQGFFSAGLTSHELAHQWFGDHVTCGSWADIWVNEGFASYSEYLMLEKLFPGDEKVEMANNHSSVMQQPSGSVYVLDSLNSTRIFSSRLTYNKGASIIHTFRYLVNNDSLFFDALRKYQIQFADSVALGTDVQHLLELASGRNLSPDFEQWYYGEGYPTYSVRWNTVSGNLHLRFTQTVTRPTVTPLFTTPLEVKFLRTGKPDTTVKFAINANTQTLIVPGMGNVSAISAVDPNNWIINKTGNISKDPTLIVTGVEKPETTDNHVAIFPNPAKDFVQVRTEDASPQTLNILNPKGQLIHQSTFRKETQVSLSGFKDGLYLFQIESQDGNKKSFRVVRK